ncbi:RNA polymerase sigma factor [Lewinella sp. LCG006]|uniref:RNA polymerase sigma factor n=1 Tax=Lewinella sp. LCG006 TaxID=3231911 RepID=UPI003461690E
MTATFYDDVLLAKARKGDTRAFGLLVERHEATVRGIIGGMLGTEEVDDVAQEVFMKFYRALENFQGDAALGTYLGRIAINTSLTAIAKRKKRRWLPWSKLEEYNAAEQADSSQSPDRADLRDTLQAALRQLHEDQRAVVVLRLVEGYSVSETAKMLDVPMGTVASRLSRAQKELQQILKPILKQ